MDDFLVINDLLGGRSGNFHCSLGDDNNQVDEAFNIDYFFSRCGNRRWGATELSLGGGITHGVQDDADFALLRYVPNGDPGKAELWCINHCTGAIPGSIQVNRMTTAGWSAPTLKDIVYRNNVNDDSSSAHGVALNGKFFLTYKTNTGIDRLHVWDGTTVRRVGIYVGTNVPTNASFPAGAVTDVRQYKVAWTKQVAGVTTYRSELTDFSAPQTITAHACQMTRPTAPNEGETHWEIYAFSDDDNYATGYLIGTPAIATTTFTDSLVVLVGDAPPEIGLNEIPGAWKFMMKHGNRLLGAGSYEGGLQSRVWFTAPLGSSNIGDDERVPDTLFEKNRVDLDENDGGVITGFGGVINGTPIVFKYSSMYRLVATGQLSAPYRQDSVPISSLVGCIRQETVVMGEDETGSECIYWLSAQGPYRYGKMGLQYLGKDIEDVRLDARNGTLASTFGQAHGVWHADKKQVWWWIAASTGNGAPNRKIVFHVQQAVVTAQGVRKGWVLHDGESALAKCSVMFSAIPNVSNGLMSFHLLPYMSLFNSQTRTPPHIFICDALGFNQDVGGDYVAFVRTKAYALQGVGNRTEGVEPILITMTNPIGSGALVVQVAAQMKRDYGEETVASAVDYNGQLSTNQYRFAKLPVTAADARVVQVEYGDVGSLSAGGDYWWGVEGLAIQRKGDDRI